MTERGACSQSLCLTIHSPFPPFNYYSAALFFAHALFLCFSVVHLFASSLCFWHRRHRARKKPTETFAFFLSTCSTPASLVMAGSPLFLSLSLSLSLPNKTSAALCQLWAWATLQKHCCLRKWSGIEEKVLLRLRVEACFLFPLRTCYWSLCSSSFWVYPC